MNNGSGNINPIKICFLIMAGGNEMRFGPVKKYIGSKNSIKIDGRDEVLKETKTRCESIVKKLKAEDNLEADIYLITNQNQKNLIDRFLGEEDTFIPSKNVFIEPEPRDTAACILVFAQRIMKVVSDKSILCVLPSDHDVVENELYIQTIYDAIKYIKDNPGKLATIGTVPTFPVTSYGYIGCKDRKEKVGQIANFDEKPDKKTAEEYIESGKYLWNTGIFIAKINVFLELFKKYFNKAYLQIEEVERTINEEQINKKLKDIYSSIERISFDKAIMVNAVRTDDKKKLIVFYGDFRWQDIGKWDALAVVTYEDQGSSIVEIVGVDIGTSTVYKTGKLMFKANSNEKNKNILWLYYDERKKSEIENIIEKGAHEVNVKAFTSYKVEELLTKIPLEGKVPNEEPFYQLVTGICKCISNIIFILIGLIAGLLIMKYILDLNMNAQGEISIVISLISLIVTLLGTRFTLHKTMGRKLQNYLGSKISAKYGLLENYETLINNNRNREC